MTFFLKVTPFAHGDPEFATYYLRIEVMMDRDPSYLLAGEGRNLHGDYGPLFGTATRYEDEYRVSLFATLDTSHEKPYRGHYILTQTLILDRELRGVAYNGNVNVDLGPQHNDYSIGMIEPVSELEFYAQGRAGDQANAR